MRTLRLIAIGLWGIALLLVLVQNRETVVPVVLFGAPGTSLSLAMVLFTAYLIGIGLGLLLLGCWWLHEYWMLRHSERQLLKLSDRVAFLQSQMGRRDHLPPPSEYSVPSEVVSEKWSEPKWDS